MTLAGHGPKTIQGKGPRKVAKGKDSRGKGSQRVGQTVTLMDIPVELIERIADFIIQGVDGELHTHQVVAADLMSLTSTCKGMNTEAIKQALWIRFAASCPPVPACPLDEDMEVIQADHFPMQAPALRASPRKRQLRQPRLPERTNWEDVSEALHQDETMFGRDSLVAILLALGVPHSPHAASRQSLLSAAHARLVPKGCSYPLRAVLCLRKDACQYLAKHEARSQYCLNQRDLASLARKNGTALHGRTLQFKKHDVIKAAIRKFGSSSALQKSRQEAEAEANAKATLESRRVTAGQTAWLEANGDRICSECGLPYRNHLYV